MNHRGHRADLLAAVALSVCALLLVSPAIRAATPFSEYLSRVGQAARMTEELQGRLDGGSLSDYQAREETRQALKTVRQMLPATEDIEFNRAVIHVDNSWLHQAGDRANQQGRSGEEVKIVAARLGALERRLKAAANPTRESSAERDRLERILAQSEYKDELQKESAIERWFRKVTEKIIEFLSRLFSSGGGKKPAQPSAGTLNLFRVLLLAAIVAAVVFGSFRLLRQLRQRVQEDAPAEKREILGEVIEEGTTSEDLFRNAAELARHGNYRMAIRRAYVALLYELELRGKLQLHRSKTNRDYLRELSSEKYIYSPVEAMTRSFERAWYGQAETGMEDYSGFVEKYREVVSVR
ncbi:MAG TPA: DUF4129 domain-containing protein [Blastocatellia bacterium]|nr:DUF4129 domain-containing protein [Blastocatellia bacterium]